MQNIVVHLCRANLSIPFILIFPDQGICGLDRYFYQRIEQYFLVEKRTLINIL